MKFMCVCVCVCVCVCGVGSIGISLSVSLTGFYEQTQKIKSLFHVQEHIDSTIFTTSFERGMSCEPVLLGLATTKVMHVALLTGKGMCFWWYEAEHVVIPQPAQSTYQVRISNMFMQCIWVANYVITSAYVGKMGSM